MPDLIVKIDDGYICIEMNNRDEKYRTLEYSDRVFRKSIKVGGKYYYSRVVAIDINNFYYKEVEKFLEMFWIQTDEHLSYSKKVYVQVLSSLNKQEMLQ